MVSVEAGHSGSRLDSEAADPPATASVWNLFGRGRRRNASLDHTPVNVSARAAPSGDMSREAQQSTTANVPSTVQLPRAGGFRRCGSVPTLSSLGGSGSSATEGEGLDVYVALRPFYCKLPLVDGLKDSLLMDMGACHHIVVLKAPDGTLTACDYGPNGGRDVAVSAPAGVWRLFNRNTSRSASVDQSLLTETERQIAGEVRERKLKELPMKSMYIGRTHLKMNDIRSFNQLQQQIYRLHHNDCRHYVNKLVKFATGIDCATQAATRHIFSVKRRQRHLGDQLICMGHNLTDIGAWPKLRAAGQATLAAIAAIGTRRAWTRIATVRAPLFPARAAANPQRAIVMARALPRPPRVLLPVGAVAAAGAAAGEASIFASVGDGIKSATGNAVSLFQGIGRSAVQAAAAASGNAANAKVVTVGVCGAATRGMAGLMAQQGSPTRAAPRLPALPRFRRRKPGEQLALAGR